MGDAEYFLQSSVEVFGFGRLTRGAFSADQGRILYFLQTRGVLYCSFKAPDPVPLYGSVEADRSSHVRIIFSRRMLFPISFEFYSSTKIIFKLMELRRNLVKLGLFLLSSFEALPEVPEQRFEWFSALKGYAI